MKIMIIFLLRDQELFIPEGRSDDFGEHMVFRGIRGGGGQRGGSVVANRVLMGDYRKMTAD